VSRLFCAPARYGTASGAGASPAPGYGASGELRRRQMRPAAELDRYSVDVDRLDRRRPRFVRQVDVDRSFTVLCVSGKPVCGGGREDARLGSAFVNCPSSLSSSSSTEVRAQRARSSPAVVCLACVDDPRPAPTSSLPRLSPAPRQSLPPGASVPPPPYNARTRSSRRRSIVVWTLDNIATPRTLSRRRLSTTSAGRSRLPEQDRGKHDIRVF